MHNRCADLAKQVESGYIRVMDQLDKTLVMICEAETEIYEDLADTEVEGLLRLKHDKDLFFDTLSFVDGEASLENYEIVRRAAEEKQDSDLAAAERSLRSLLQTRAKVMETKVKLQTAILEKIVDGDVGASQ